MQLQEEVYNKLKEILIHEFEIDENIITLEATLYEDLGLDSIDAVDIMLNIKEFTGKKLSPEDFKNTRTIQDVIDAIVTIINA